MQKTLGDSPSHGGARSLMSHWLGDRGVDKAHQASALQVVSEVKSRSVMSDPLQPAGPYSPWNSPGQNTGVGSVSLL